MLKNNHLYKKVSSYEGNYGEVKKVLLLYSGGLDTSVMLKWIQDQYKAEVYSLTLDLGQQHDNLEAIRQKAVRFGAKKALVWNVKDEFAESYLSLAIKANASYQGNYHLSTPIGRALMAVKTVEAAKKLEVETIAHGCTGKGNDQVRLEGYILTHDPKIKIIAPVREWSMDRSEEIKYAQKNKIPIPSSIDFPYSVDDNMWGMTWEGGEVEIPSEIPQLEKFLTTYTLASKAPDKEEVIVLEFENGLPVSLNGKKYKLADLVQKLNVIVGKHGVGVVHLLEDRLVGLKTRGVYEMPAAAVIIAAHKDLEKYVSTRKLNQLKSELDIKWGYLCYGALWFDPVMKAINSFNQTVNEKVTGTVKIRLYKGQATIVALESPYALDYASFSNSDGFAFNTNCSAGFIEIYSLQMRLSNQKQIK